MPKTDDLFVRIPRTFADALDCGELDWLEFCVLFHLHSNANFDTGAVGTHWRLLAEELHDLLEMVGIKKDKANKITKVMASLREKGYVDYKDHAGSRSKIKVRLHHFKLRRGHYTDIHTSQHKPASRGPGTGELNKYKTPEELIENEQRSQPRDSGGMKPIGDTINKRRNRGL